MKKPNCRPKELLAKVPESNLPNEKLEGADSDLPYKKERRGPVPPPSYTLEELLAKVPEPKAKVPEPGFSGEVDTGLPVGKEVW